MITTYCANSTGWDRHGGFVTSDAFRRAVWIDLVTPTEEEEQHVEGVLGLDLPTREEMRAIEDSNRLYEAHGALFLTATVMVNSEGEYPRADDLLFVITPHVLVTIRYAEPKAIRLYASRVDQQAASGADAEAVLLGLLDTLVERIGESIERVGRALDELVHLVLSPDDTGGKRRLDYAAMLRQLERNQTLTAKARGSLNSLARLLGFATRPALGFGLTPQFHARAATLAHDIQALVDHTGFLATSISFELAAILGMVNIEQNGIIKIFSVAAVVFLPPTLVASVYGMNFRVMPELTLPLGYPLALVLMVASAAMTYGFFKRRGWW
jgi:magnesium transporter